MDIGPLVQRDAAAAQIGDAVDRRACQNDHRLAVRRRRLNPDIHDRHAGGLAEDGRRVAGDAEIDAVRPHRLQQSRAAQKLGPGDAHVQRCEFLLQRAARLFEHQRAVFLVADAEGEVLGRGRAAQAQAGQGGEGEQDAGRT